MISRRCARCRSFCNAELDRFCADCGAPQPPPQGVAAGPPPAAFAQPGKDLRASTAILAAIGGLSVLGWIVMGGQGWITLLVLLGVAAQLSGSRRPAGASSPRNVALRILAALGTVVSVLAAVGLGIGLLILFACSQMKL